METTANGSLVLPIDVEAGAARLSIEHVSGEVKISGWDRSEVAISSPQAGEEASLEDMFYIRHDGNEVEIKLANNSANLGRRFKTHRTFDIGGMIRVAVGIGLGATADLEVKVPYVSDVRVRTASGDVTIEDVDGRISISTASGDIEMQSVAGNVMVKSASGDIEMADFAGRLGVRTMSGDVEVEASELLDVSIGTASGDVEISGKLAQDGEYDVQSISGDVTLALPGETSCSAEIHTISGDIRCRLPHESSKHGRRDQRLSINGGDGPNLRLNTTSGDVLIREWSGEPQQRSGRGAATERLGQLDEAVKARVEGGNSAMGNTVRLDNNPQGQEPQMSQMQILEAIERGEMTVEEGLRRMGESS